MEKTFKTRLNKDDKNPVETKAVIDWTGVTTEELQKLAAATVIIDQQAIYRTSGVIPATDTISVRKLLDTPRGAGGFKPTPENMAARIGKMDADAYRKTLEALGLSGKELDRMVKAKFG